MSRELKFRIWSFNEKIFHYSDAWEGFSGYHGSLSSPQQFTGLKDKNGREIYEGDIISDYFDMGPGGFIISEWKVEFDAERGYQWEYWDMATIEVIGNAFESPELLK